MYEFFMVWIELAIKAFVVVLTNRSVLLGSAARLTLGLFRQEHRVNVRQNPARGDGDGAQKLGQLLIVTDRQLNVTRDDSRLFVIPRRVTREFEHFSRQVFQHRREVHRRARAHSLRVLLRLEVSRDATDRELKSRLGRSAHRLLSRLSFPSAGHVFVSFRVFRVGLYRPRALKRHPNRTEPTRSTLSTLSSESLLRVSIGCDEV